MQAFEHKTARLLALAMTFFAVMASHAGSLTAQLDRQSVPVGETVTLSLVFEGVNPQGTPSLPNLPNLAFQGVTQSTSMTIFNGQTTSKLTFNYVFQATQPGEVFIPAMQVQAGGQILTSQPLKLTVLPASGAANALTNIAFIRLVVPKTEAYVGEAVPVEMQLYCQTVEGVQLPQLKAEGFSLGQSAEPTQTQTQVGGAVYNLFIFKLSATAARAGRLTLGPAECNLTLLIPIRRRDPFDPFGFFGGSHQRRPTTLQSEPVEMNILPLPQENVPPNFNGAVGSFTMGVTAAPTNVVVGDPITVKVNISGRGRLDALTLPEQPQWRDFKTYSATKRIESGDPLGLSGTAAFEQVVTPQNHEIRQLPPLEFTFFDPAQRQYRTLRSGAIPLSVRNTSVAVVPPPVPTNAAQNVQAPAADDILHIRSQFAAGGPARGMLVERPWILGLQLAPVAAWLALLIARKRRESLENNPRLRRRREVAQRVREGIHELHRLAGAQDSDAFFATLFRLLQEQIGERLDMPASAITEAVIEERLRGSALAPETLETLRELFQLCNQARYAPHKSRQELTAIIPRAEAVLRDLQKLNA